MSKKEVAIIMGSDSDLTIMKDAAQILEDFNISYDLTIVSAHRTPKRMVQYATEACQKGIKVIIAGAGGSAHLPGMIASLTSLPVIGVPIRGNSLDGLDSLLSIVQMPPGVPVATVAINGGKNAAILACQILGIENKTIFEKIEKYKLQLKNKVLTKASKLEKTGWKEYVL
ncbi:MAG TPA: 5-(carboxyamino)imidazole ribonucleotide mutase [Nitrososphaeraceae archaeon]|nr:5-(carboxyamino)imidazole ribonucleotide mutase [Nitrososphaeraceae archaeon]